MAESDQRIVELCKQTGYSIVQINGQRKYGGPPPNWEGPPPAKGCEVFVGKLPRELKEDTLVPLFERAGRLYEFRLMMDFSGSNRGYAFAQYTNPNDARRAIGSLDNYEILPGLRIGVMPSVDNCRLYVKNIPKHKQRDEVKDEMSRITEGVVNVIMYPGASDKQRSRGYAFVEYENHRMAAMARRNLVNSKATLFGASIVVDWAEPEQQVDAETMSKVKILHLRNLLQTTSEEKIRHHFELVSGVDTVERVKKIKDFAFVHFRTRLDAQACLDELNGTCIDGAVIEVVWSKPPDPSKVMQYVKKAQKMQSLVTSTGNFHRDLISTARALHNADLIGIPIMDQQGDINKDLTPLFLRQLQVRNGNPSPQSLSPTANPPVRPSAMPPISRGAQHPVMPSTQPALNLGPGGDMAARQQGRSAAGCQSAGLRQAVQRALQDANTLAPKFHKLSLASVEVPMQPQATLYPVPLQYVDVNQLGGVPLLSPTVSFRQPSFCEILEELSQNISGAPVQYSITSVTGGDGLGRDVNLYWAKIASPSAISTSAVLPWFINTQQWFMDVLEAKETVARLTLLQLGIVTGFVPGPQSPVITNHAGAGAQSNYPSYTLPYSTTNVGGLYSVAAQQGPPSDPVVGKTSASISPTTGNPIQSLHGSPQPSS